ncbi:hypothetical protein [Enterococcus sp. DIV1420a]|uniref:hypothetical protein n=1 Tax=Enterococcus TaxID=1350 RepID=UPI003F274451
MKKQVFSSPISRLFPKKIVSYLLNEVQNILDKDNASKFLSNQERSILVTYKNKLLDDKIYYDKVNLEFVKMIYPLIINKKISQETQFLYSEILRINPRLITTRLGNELIFNKIIN